MKFAGLRFQAASALHAIGPSGGSDAYAKLWIVLCVLVATLHVFVAFLTQTGIAGLLAACVWGGAFICMEDRVPARKPEPTGVGFAIGCMLLVAVLWRTAQITHWDVVFYGLPLVASLGLALLYLPARRIGEFGDAVLVSALLLAAVFVLRALPERELSELTAHLTKLLLAAIGVESRVDGRAVMLARGGVSIQGPCSGVEQVAQLMVVSVIFLLAFRMRSWARRASMLALAPVLGVVGNSFRIACLSIITSSDWGYKDKLFRFFHDDSGSLIFAGLTVWVFGLIYLRVLEPELGPRQTRVAHA
jgi:cyanoexosortase A